MEEKEKVRVGVGVIIVKDDKVLLGKRKNSHGEGAWSFPGGHLEFNESWEDCATRETMEETGIVIKNIRFGAVTNDIFRVEGKHYITVFIISDYASGRVKIMEPEKCERWDWFEWNQLPKPLFLTIQNLLKQKFNPLENKTNHKMTEVSNEKIIEIAKQCNKDGVLWHNHFLAVKCIYNTSGKFQVILENEQSGKVYFSNFDKQPTGTLKLLEDLFFEQEKEK